MGIKCLETQIIPIKITKRRESDFHFLAKKTDKLEAAFVTASIFDPDFQKHAFKKQGVHLGEQNGASLTCTN